MSKTLVIKASSSILVCLVIFAAAAYSVLAQEATEDGVIRNLPLPKRINVKQNIVAPKLETLRAKQASREAALIAKLQTFKNKEKALITERVNTNLNKINQNQTAQMQRHLDNMSVILDKLENRVNQGTPDIKDPAAVKAAILAARTSIATISAAVTAQSQNDYTIQVTSEARIKASVKTQRDKLYTDLQTVRKMVIDAKKSVADAIRTARAGTVVDIPEANKEATSSGQ